MTYQKAKGVRQNLRICIRFVPVVISPWEIATHSRSGVRYRRQDLLLHQRNHPPYHVAASSHAISVAGSAIRFKNHEHTSIRMDYGDTTDGILGILLACSLASCGLTIVLSALFPCSCRPRRDCRRNCADCRRDRQKCRQYWYDTCTRRERANTEEELISPI